MLQRHTVSTCVVILTGILVFIALREAVAIFAPMMLALVFGIILSPLSDFFCRLRLPTALAALLTCILGLAVVGVVAILLEPAVSKAIDQAPLIWTEIKGLVSELQRMLRGLEEITEEIAATTGNGDTGSTEGDVPLPSASNALFLAPDYLGRMFIFIGTLYFFLLGREDIYRWAGKSFNRLGDRELRWAEKRVAKYFITITAINASFGTVIFVVMTILGMPTPIFWGVLAFLVNFILYLGPICLAVTLLLVGSITFVGPYGFLPALTYLVLNATEGQFVTPGLVGKSMRVNPLLVFLSLVVWIWLWGPVGGFIAIPVLIWSLAVANCILNPVEERPAGDDQKSTSGGELSIKSKEMATS
ncbi:AI-2E family transporter [Litoreibacter roseus]|uniref:AI-2E family transporter n=1 Tax=Litoreibacter roseus TaxID=2601869 RepID=A0A6N6JJJ0_9RHOB|nr:AI-2E family transporter [Litoreibacter roseus]GFE66117.1 AI-2E family transporter [Litoreibacter roseus]